MSHNVVLAVHDEMVIVKQVKLLTRTEAIWYHNQLHQLRPLASCRDNRRKVLSYKLISSGFLPLARYLEAQPLNFLPLSKQML